MAATAYELAPLGAVGDQACASAAAVRAASSAAAAELARCRTCALHRAIAAWTVEGAVCSILAFESAAGTVALFFTVLGADAGLALDTRTVIRVVATDDGKYRGDPNRRSEKTSEDVVHIQTVAPRCECGSTFGCGLGHTGHFCSTLLEGGDFVRAHIRCAHPGLTVDVVRATIGAEIYTRVDHARAAHQVEIARERILEL